MPVTYADDYTSIGITTEGWEFDAISGDYFHVSWQWDTNWKWVVGVYKDDAYFSLDPGVLPYEQIADRNIKNKVLNNRFYYDYLEQTARFRTALQTNSYGGPETALSIPENMNGSLGFDVNEHDESVGQVHHTPASDSGPTRWDQFQAAYWNDEGDLTELAALEHHNFSAVYGINNIRHIVGVSIDSATAFNPEALLWMNNEVYNINSRLIGDNNSQIQLAWSINDSKQIVAYNYAQNKILLLTPTITQFSDLSVDITETSIANSNPEYPTLLF